MYQHPEALENLIECLRRFPGVGRRGAERMALSLLDWRAEELELFGELIGSLPRSVTYCPECGAFAEEGAPCTICADPKREESLLCIVENPSQVANFERSGTYRGRYHVLGGRLSPLERKTADDLALPGLFARLNTGRVSEVIMALSGDVEGRATAVYLTERIRQSSFTGVVTQLASGLPAGANLSYADPATLAAALSGRIKV